MSADNRIGILFVFATLVLAPFADAQGGVDSVQARAMLRLLERCKAGPVPEQAVQQVIELRGSQLLIGQQNILRRVTAAQYKAILTSACKGEIARISPLEPGPRAEKGAQGLMNDVGPSLIWGREHGAELESALAAAASNPDFGQAVPLAWENLPEKIDLSPKLYFVMGGRAGAAASDDGIYIDLLNERWKTKGASAGMTPREMVEFFAHEAHHVGYGQILDGKRPHNLSAGQAQAWSFLSALLMEGSATLLINAHGSWPELESMDHIKPDVARLPQLLPKAQELFRRSLQGELSKEEFDAMDADFLGEGYHATGARLLYVIQAARGKAGVLNVMDNPTSLLKVYNQCASEVNEPFLFDASVADALDRLGKR